jgi:putative thioredoxin
MGMSDVIAFPHDDNSSPHVIDGSTATFMDDVMQTSLHLPVIVDFWATWCGPCKTLTPVLEKHVAAQGGRVKLVKIDIDKNQQLAAQFRIQSVPTVFAFFQGQPVDAFQGGQPESQVRAFIERLVRLAPANAGSVDVKALYTEAATALAAGDLDGAEMAYADIINAVPAEAAAHIGLLRVQLQRGNIDMVRQVVAELPADIKAHKDFHALQSALELADQTANAGPVAELQAAVVADPMNNDKCFALAQALFASGDIDGAFDQLFAIVQRDRQWNDDAARQQILKICETIGLEDARSRAARRRLSAIIFT